MASFELVYSDSDGVSDIVGAGSLINNEVDGRNACWFYYDVTMNKLSLASDDIRNWKYRSLRTRRKLENSQCSIIPREVQVNRRGNELVLTVPVTFKRNFGGRKNLYLYAIDTKDAFSDYLQKGTWTVP